jgi:predicted RNA-binding protein
MCESKVYLLKNGEETLLMEDVVKIEVDGGKVILQGLLGEKMEVEGRITLMDMRSHKILLEG